ncbi:UNVERIFIED_CONTAM: hypothetical protein PYX00_011821 [Menopon gallinae]|uniref:PDZ domain-containing protein n=1 Tax=Menopon gallinae TaxID=328185 RepID=A0AAW2H8M7_9NEOP
MGAIQSSVRKCLVVLRVNDSSKCFPHLSPFVHAITKYNSTPIHSEDDIKKMATLKHLDLEVLDLRNAATKSLSVSTPLGIGVKFCVPRLLELKVLEVERGSSAEGKIAEGDFVVGIENFYFETNDEFFYAIYRNRGSRLNFIVYRDGQVRRVPITLSTHEPFLGAVLGEGILMAADKSGDVVNIGTHSVCRPDGDEASSADASGVQSSAEQAMDSMPQNVKDTVVAAAVDGSSAEHGQCENSQARRTEEQGQCGENRGVQLDKALSKAAHMESDGMECNAKGEALHSGTSSAQDNDDTLGNAATGEPGDSLRVGASRDFRPDAESIELSSVSITQQSAAVFREDNASQAGREVGVHAQAETSVSAQEHCPQTAPAYHAQHSALDSPELKPEGEADTCPVVGEYSSEDKIKLLEALTGAKDENVQEPEYDMWPAQQMKTSLHEQCGLLLLCIKALTKLLKRIYVHAKPAEVAAGVVGYDYGYTSNPAADNYYAPGYYAPPAFTENIQQQAIPLQKPAGIAETPPKSVEYVPITAPKIKSTTIKVNEKRESPLDKLIKDHPEIGNKLKKIFEYNGIMPPWNPLKDLSSLEQQRLPDSCMLYMKMKDVLKVFESLKEMIADELLKVETYVKRAKAYLREKREKLERNLDRMKRYMKKIKKSKSDSVRAEYARKFREVQADTRKTMEEYQSLKKWMVGTLNNFKTLF